MENHQYQKSQSRPVAEYLLHCNDVFLPPTDWSNIKQSDQEFGRKRLGGTSRDREDSGKKKGREDRRHREETGVNYAYLTDFCLSGSK